MLYRHRGLYLALFHLVVHAVHVHVSPIGLVSCPIWTQTLIVNLLAPSIINTSPELTYTAAGNVVSVIQQLGQGTQMVHIVSFSFTLVTTFSTWAWAEPLGIALLIEILYKADHNQTH